VNKDKKKVMMRWNGGRKFNLDSFFDICSPALLCFGPIIMASGLTAEIEMHGAYLPGQEQADVGALMLAIGLAGIFLRQHKILDRLEALERLEKGDSA